MLIVWLNQVFCHNDNTINKFITSNYTNICVNVCFKCPKNYKMAFRFIYAIINLFRINGVIFIALNKPKPYTHLSFLTNNKGIVYSGECYGEWEARVFLYTKNPTYKSKRDFYRSIMEYFFGYIRNYDAIDEDVPLKQIVFK